MRQLRTSLAMVLCAGLMVLLGPAPGAYAARWPAAPTGVSVVALTGTSFTVKANPAIYATSYRLYVSRNRADLQLARLSRARMISARVPRITAGSLAYVAAPLYWRWASVNGTLLRYSGINSTSLRPASPNGLAVGTDPGLFLTWNSVPVTALIIAQSTDPAMVANRKQYVIRQSNNQFTPYDLDRGTRYYFQVKAVNGSTYSQWSSQVSALVAHDSVDVRFMSYNILNLSADGTTPRDMTIAPWLSERLDAAADLIRGAGPAIIAVQEGSQYTGPTWLTPWQVDTLVQELGSDWTVAHTQGRWFEPNYRLTGSHVVYQNSVFEAPQNGGHWALGDGKYAAYQLLRHRSSGANLLVVSTHLTTQSGAAYDAIRRAQTQVMVDRARAYSASHGNVPILYGGDVGSVLMSWAPYDAPGIIMRSVRTADAFNVAQSVINGRYSSVNQYRQMPIVDAGSVDRMFASPGIAVRAWNQALNVSDGRFVGVLPSDHNPVYSDVTLPVNAR